MTTARLFFALLLSCAFVSCGHNADLKYPTVTQADEMDVQWGLQRRKSRGGPKQFFNSRSPEAIAAGFTESPAQMAPASGGQAAAGAGAGAGAQPSVNVPANLR